MKRFLTGLLTCVSLSFMILPAHADKKPSKPVKQQTSAQQPNVQQNLPFVVTPTKGFQPQAVGISGLSVWANPNKCVLTLLTGKSNVEGYLLNKIYSNKENLDAYYLKLSKHDGLEPQTITKEEKVKLKDGKEITVFESNQTIQKQKFVFWDAFFQADDTYATLLLQCAAPGMDNKQALSMFSSVKPQKVISLDDDIKALPFKVTVAQPYYVASTSSTPPQFASLSMKQAIEQISEWPETEVFMNYDAGPYASLTEFIDKSPLSEQLQIKARSKKQDAKQNAMQITPAQTSTQTTAPATTQANEQNNTDVNNKVYVFDEKDGKNSSIVYLKRSDKGEVIVTLAIVNTDKTSVYRPIIDKINDSSEFNSKK